MLVVDVRWRYCKQNSISGVGNSAEIVKTARARETLGRILCRVMLSFPSPIMEGRRQEVAFNASCYNHHLQPAMPT